MASIYLFRFNQKRIVAVIIFFSSIFYAWWDVKYLFLMYFSIAVNYYLGKLLFNCNSKAMLISGISFNLALLVVFKYLILLVETANDWFMLQTVVPKIVLPLAISFYTFQQIAFLVDTHAKKIPSYPGFGIYSMFVLFFPQLIAGPIVHWREVFSQYASISKRLSWENLYIGSLIFIIGLFKKVILADTFAGQADLIFSTEDYNNLTPLAAWAGCISYGLQIYFDFSAYADMAIGLARMIGIELPINFLSPYKSKSIIEFWRRWHITLSTFLRDYIYIPLGGNRKGWTRQMINIMITMLLGGIWHGASWAFLWWGGLHGIYIVLNHAWCRFSDAFFPSLKLSRTYSAIAVFVTIILVFWAWVPFRVNNGSDFFLIWSKMIDVSGLFVLPERYGEANMLLTKVFEVVGFQFGSNEQFPVFRFMLVNFLGLIMVLFCPNTIELFWPYFNQIKTAQRSLRCFNFSSVNYAHPLVTTIMSICFFVSVLYLFRVVKFIYFQF